MTKILTLCADDFGQNAAISRAILELADAGRISAASCMVNGADWSQSAPILAAAQCDIDAGLHLNFTDYAPLGAMPRLAPGGTLPGLNRLMMIALSGRLDAAEIRAECRRQFDEFCRAMGKLPSHIDGHQHVHVFPVIRNAVIELAAAHGCYVRHCATQFSMIAKRAASPIKALAVNAMGMGFGDALQGAAISHNREFFGIHDFRPEKRSAHSLYEQWLREAGEGTLINCHPGAWPIAGDPLTGWREHEYDFLRGDGFAALLRDGGWRIGKFQEITVNGA
ncbi:MAG: ChbG/HpnK family deacetylase [Alphaproteobacteria bacterium]